MRDWIHNMYSLEMVYTTFNLERRNTQHILMRDGPQIIPVVRVESGYDTGHWFLFPLLLRHYSTPFTKERRSQQHLLIKQCFHSIYSWEMEYIIFTNESWSSQLFSQEIWSQQHFVRTDGFHSIHSQEMASKAVTHERWNPQHLLTTYGVYKIYTR